MEVILFEDEVVPWLSPATLGRPAFSVRCGSYCLSELVRRLGLPVASLVRPHLREVLAADHPDLVNWSRGTRGPKLLVNARLVPSAGLVARLHNLIDEGRPAVVRYDRAIALAVLPPDAALASDGDFHQFAALCETLEPLLPDAPLPMFEYPHDLLRHHRAALEENLADRLARDGFREIADGVFAAEDASLGEHCVTDTREGPILLDQGVRVGPFCFLAGPVYLGPGTKVLEHAALKDGVAAGHTCKIGGEVEAATIEPYTNKQHHGFLGHSYLGSWVNLGAGTCNSDLKNTYGNVSMNYMGRRAETGMQFVGCIVGDYSKTAINTSVFTGKTIGVCSMVYGFVTTNVPSFTNYARSFGQVTEAPAPVMVATQARMFKRRGVAQRPIDAALLHAMYELTRHERQLANEPLSL